MEGPWEDNLLERKSENDLKDLLKTMVAFANSVQPGHSARILIGELDDGRAQGVNNADNIQKKVLEAADKIYPPILWHSKVYEKDGKTCVEITIEYNGETPHFGGIAWVRKGSVTKSPTDEIFQKLIELRTDKVRELFKWIHKKITIVADEATIPRGPRNDSASLTVGRWVHRWGWPQEVKLVDVNQFWLTVEDAEGVSVSEPLRKITLSFDHEKDRLKIIVDY